ncbi:hypothetical protein BJ741DRAFT_587099 [Chytriomyces cf. hyalinus JEL632]|nr:hypothetical protein BJ741DRAFT_587099 [Chytriomyces cf. hyalinus JEL632]
MWQNRHSNNRDRREELHPSNPGVHVAKAVAVRGQSERTPSPAAWGPAEPSLAPRPLPSFIYNDAKPSNQPLHQSHPNLWQQHNLPNHLSQQHNYPTYNQFNPPTIATLPNGAPYPIPLSLASIPPPPSAQPSRAFHSYSTPSTTPEQHHPQGRHSSLGHSTPYASNSLPSADRPTMLSVRPYPQRLSMVSMRALAAHEVVRSPPAEVSPEAYQSHSMPMPSSSFAHLENTHQSHPATLSSTVQNLPHYHAQSLPLFSPIPPRFDSMESNRSDSVSSNSRASLPPRSFTPQPPSGPPPNFPQNHYGKSMTNMMHIPHYPPPQSISRATTPTPPAYPPPNLQPRSSSVAEPASGSSSISSYLPTSMDLSGNPYTWNSGQVAEWLRTLGAKQETLSVILSRQIRMDQLLRESSPEVLQQRYLIQKLGPRLLIHDHLSKIKLAYSPPPTAPAASNSSAQSSMFQNLRDPFAWSPMQVGGWLKTLGAKEDTAQIILEKGTTMQDLVQANSDVLMNVYKLSKLGPRLLILDQLERVRRGESVEFGGVGGANVAASGASNEAVVSSDGAMGSLASGVGELQITGGDDDVLPRYETFIRR